MRVENIFQIRDDDDGKKNKPATQKVDILS